MTENGILAALAAAAPPTLVLLGILYAQVKSTTWAQHHQSVIRLWGLADDIATRIVSALATPASTIATGAAGRAAQQSAAVRAGVAELRTTGADALSHLQGPAPDDATLARLISTRVDRQVLAAPDVPDTDVMPSTPVDLKINPPLRPVPR